MSKQICSGSLVSAYEPSIRRNTITLSVAKSRIILLENVPAVEATLPIFSRVNISDSDEERLELKTTKLTTFNEFQWMAGEPTILLPK